MYFVVNLIMEMLATMAIHTGPGEGTNFMNLDPTIQIPGKFLRKHSKEGNKIMDNSQ